MNWKEVEAYFGITIGLIFITAAFILAASRYKIEGQDETICYLGLSVFGIISLIFGLYDYNRLDKK